MPIQTLHETISTTLDSHSQKITIIEDTLTAHSDELAELTTRVGQLEKRGASIQNRGSRKSLQTAKPENHRLARGAGRRLTGGIHLTASSDSYRK